MGNFKEEERLKALRERLYSRGQGSPERQKFSLKDIPTEDVPTAWQSPPKPKEPDIIPASNPMTQYGAPEESEPDIMARKKINRTYRWYIVLAGIAFFFIAVGISSLFFLFGSNRISGENIAVNISGPFTVGGGEAIPLQIGITNQNTVPIKSATLIITYPTGTQSAVEPGTDLFVERLPLDQVSPGETLNIPVRAVVFGEENEEKIISAEVEYRVEGSNSTFAKAAEPLRFKIGSSPVIVRADSVVKVSSGQESEITLTISSNSQNPLTDLLVKADYPSGFDYASSEPAPVSGQNIWSIARLDPEEETTIVLRGIVTGKETDEYAMHFSIGVPEERNPTILAAVFSTVSTNFEIEVPFLDVRLLLNNSENSTVPVDIKDRVRAEVIIENTLSDTIYDGRVELVISGNALSDYEVSAGNGFYNSINNSVLWDSSMVSALREIAPGKDVRLQISLEPDPDIDVTPQLAFDVDVHARRVNEGQVTEQLLGTAAAVAKVSSEANILSEVGRNTSIFSDTGPLPPVAEAATTYTITLLAENGTNDVDDVEVTASLPPYVSWLNKSSGAGTVTFNETTRTVTWNLKEILANQSKIVAFQVSLLPSKSQIGTNPTLIGTQRLRATDAFTGSIITDQSEDLNTQLSEEAGYPNDIGEVVEAE